MASKKLGEIKGPFIVWLFVTSYFALSMVFSGSANGALPQNLTMPVVLNLLVAMARGWGVILAFLFLFLAWWERRRRVREIFSSVGLKRTGSVQSVVWSLALFPIFIAVGLTTMMLSHFLSPLSTSVSSNGQTPLWYLWYMVIYSFFPVAVVEEAIARGYLLDRLMPQHPSSLAKALPAILLSSLLFTLWHLPSYLLSYPLSPTWAIGLLAGNVYPISVVLGIAYVRARTQNIIGPLLIHFLLDSIPIILSLA